MFNTFEFANEGFLYFLIAIPLLVVWYWFRHKRNYAELKIPFSGIIEKTRKSPRTYLIHSLFVLRMLALIFLIIAFARPQSSSSNHKEIKEGIDIVMAIDVSTSMLARDHKPDRLGAAKNVAKDFINGRPDDRIGLVVFSGETFTQCPLTTDHRVLLNLFDAVKTGMIEDGTAIGDGLATSVNRIRTSDAISKVIILLTDGVNNRGSIAPLTAAEIAKAFGIRVYTIGVGKEGMAPYPVQDMFGRTQYIDQEVKIDEELLQKVADQTNGKYFRADNTKKLEAIFKEIDQLEKSKITEIKFDRKHDLFLGFALIALGLFILELLLKQFVFRTIP